MRHRRFVVVGMMISVCHVLLSADICFFLIFLCCSLFWVVPAVAWSSVAAVSLVMSLPWRCQSWGFSHSGTPPAPTVPSSDPRATLCQSLGTAWSDALCRSWLSPSKPSWRLCTVPALPPFLCTTLLCTVQAHPGL